MRGNSNPLKNFYLFLFLQTQVNNRNMVFGMLPFILTVLDRDYSTPIIIPTKDCEYKGEHPQF